MTTPVVEPTPAGAPHASVAAWCRDVTKVYPAGRAGGRRTGSPDAAPAALYGVNLEVPAAALTVVSGPSGCGKSTLLRLFACLDRPTSGAVSVDGVVVSSVSDRVRRRLRRRRLGYLYPDPIDNLVEYLSLGEQVRLAGQLRGRAPTRADVVAIVDRFGLVERIDHLPSALSGGEQQRVGLACALVGNPAVVVADEPTAELDSRAAEEVLDAVEVLCSAGTAFIAASHDPRIVERADHVLRLDHGRVVEA